MPGPFATVVVPGFGGTTLSYVGGFGGKTNLWFNGPLIAAKTPLSLALDSTGAAPYPLLGQKVFPDGPIQFGIYEPLIQSLGNAGQFPVFWGYDWRLNPLTLAAQLATFLASNTLFNPFTVVAHSFGGLIAQLAYPLYVAMGAGSVWSKTVYLGTPQGGSHWAIAGLNGLYSDGAFMAFLRWLFDLSPVIDPAFAVGFKAIETSLAIAVGSWPAIYTLLPSNLGPWAGMDPNAPAALQLSTYQNGPGGVQQQWLTLAATVQAALNTGLSQPRPAELCVLGSADVTLNTLKFPAQAYALNSYGTTNDGDGTVANQRSRLPGKPNAQFKNCTHNQLCNTLGPLTMLNTWLQNFPVGATTWPNQAVTPDQPAQRLSIDVFIPGPVPFANTHGDP